jgi:CheY-like chemotaxis protein
MRRVLIIEDDPDFREALVAELGREGLSVLAADEGRKALELAEIAKPSLILLDLMTAGMTGWQVLEQRRQSPALARIPVIVMTGSREPVPGAEVVLRKPFSVEELLGVVRRLLAPGGGPGPRR